MPQTQKLIDGLCGLNQNIKTIAVNKNTQKTNVILGDKTDVVFGDGYIVQLGSYIENEYARIAKVDHEGNITDVFSFHDNVPFFDFNKSSSCEYS